MNFKSTNNELNFKEQIVLDYIFSELSLYSGTFKILDGKLKSYSVLDTSQIRLTEENLSQEDILKICNRLEELGYIYLKEHKTFCKFTLYIIYLELKTLKICEQENST